METFKGITVAIAALIIAVAIGIAGWQLDWWLAGKNQVKRTELIDKSLEAQRGVGQALTLYIGSYETTKNEGFAQQFCAEYPRLDPNRATSAQLRFAAEHC